MLGINHQSPLIYWARPFPSTVPAGNQSPIPFDILVEGQDTYTNRWESITNPL